MSLTVDVYKGPHKLGTGRPPTNLSTSITSYSAKSRPARSATGPKPVTPRSPPQAANIGASWRSRGSVTDGRRDADPRHGRAPYS